MAMWVTTVEIARKAGVSRATVDRVLNGRPGVHPRTARLVEETAKALRAAPGPRPAVQLERQARRRVTAILPAGTNGFVNELARAFENSRSPELDIFVRRSASFNVADAVASISAVSDHESGLLLVAPDAPAVHEALRRFRAAGVPVVMVASPVSGTDGYVGIDNRAAGRVAAQLVARFLGTQQRGTVGLLVGALSYRAQEEREMGFRAVLAQDAPGLEVARIDVASGNDADCNSAVRTTLREYGDLRAVYNTGGGNGGVGQALAEASRTEIVLIGHDLTDQTRQMLLTGVMDAALVQSPTSVAETAVAVMALLAGRESVAPVVRVLPSRITLRESLT